MTLLNITNQEPINYGSCTNSLRKSGWKIIIRKGKHWLRVMNWSTSHVALVMKNSNNNESSHSCLGRGSQDMNRSKILNLHKVVYSTYFIQIPMLRKSLSECQAEFFSSWHDIIYHLTFSNIILNITFVQDLSLFLTVATSLAIKAFECARSILIRRKQNAK